MTRLLIGIILLFVALSSFRPSGMKESREGVAYVTGYVKEGAVEYTAGIGHLKDAILALDSSETSVGAAKLRLAECRMKYKRIEFFVEYFFESRVKIFNLPPVYEIEEPYMEYQHPVGMQVIEAYLFDDHPVEHKDELLQEADLIYATAGSIPSMMYSLQVSDEQVLESLRLELIRMATMGITGYDAPELKTGIAEAGEAMRSLKQCLGQYKMSDSAWLYAQRGIEILAANSDFNSFDRLGFYIDAFLPLQRHLDKAIREAGLELNTSGVLNYAAGDIFNKNGLAIAAFSTDTFPGSEALVALGKQLFFEKRLSGNGKRSCATCHAPEKYFTDGLAQSVAFDEIGHTTRNAPSLLYAAYQHGQFLDARATGMTAQVKEVLQSPVEMNASLPEAIKALKADKQYRKAFEAAFPGIGKKEQISIDNIAIAITAFERSLPVMTSRFDEYLSGNRQALSASEQKGFNLFMGKAQCGSCHFAPVFNGLLPPLYDITELEALGMLASSDMKQPVTDTDSGRYLVFPIEFYIGAFKTPTVRNIAKTAPYMHNGVFNTLEEVIEFYNEGGGNGLGLDNPYQTLSDKKINLTKEEIKHITSFLESLTDKPFNG